MEARNRRDARDGDMYAEGFLLLPGALDSSVMSFVPILRPMHTKKVPLVNASIALEPHAIHANSLHCHAVAPVQLHSSIYTPGTYIS